MKKQVKEVKSTGLKMPWDDGFDPSVKEIVLEFKTCFIKRNDAKNIFGEGLVVKTDYPLLSKELKLLKQPEDLYEFIFKDEQWVRLFVAFLLMPDLKIKFENFMESIKIGYATTPNIFEEDASRLLSFADYYDAFKFVVDDNYWVRVLANYLIEIRIKKVYNS